MGADALNESVGDIGAVAAAQGSKAAGAGAGALSKGEAVWYRDRDGKEVCVEIVSVDHAAQPPSYSIKIISGDYAGHEIETERDRSAPTSPQPRGAGVLIHVSPKRLFPQALENPSEAYCHVSNIEARFDAQVCQQFLEMIQSHKEKQSDAMILEELFEGHLDFLEQLLHMAKMNMHPVKDPLARSRIYTHHSTRSRGARAAHGSAARPRRLPACCIAAAAAPVRRRAPHRRLRSRDARQPIWRMRAAASGPRGREQQRLRRRPARHGRRGEGCCRGWRRGVQLPLEPLDVVKDGAEPLLARVRLRAQLGAACPVSTG